jgi:phospholipid transport system substrate-binding protein
LELVDAKILPHFDFARMTQLAVGRSWREASEKQKQDLTLEFRTMLVRTYAKVFSTYSDPKVEVKPVKLESDATEVTVRTVIRISDGKMALVDYEMKKNPAGWKVFDVTVEGASLVTSYRGSFADQIQQTGLDGLIKTLTDKNLASNHAPVQKKAQSN